MAKLTATFSIIDRMSAQLKSIADTGERFADYWEKSGKNVQNAIDGMSAAMVDFQDIMRNIEKEITFSAKSTNEYENAIASAENSTRTATEAAKELGDTSNKIANDIETTSEITERAAEAARTLGDSASQASDSLGETADEADETADSLENLEKILAAAGIAVAINGIVEGFKYAVNAAIEYESALAGVYKTINGTAEELRQIDKDIINLSLNMPAAAVEIARVAEAAGQLGIQTADITDFTKVMVDLGNATNLSADEAATSLAQFANITGMSAENYANLGSTVVALGNNFATTEADIVYMSQRLASAGTLAGLTEPQILALSASLSSVGIEAEAGGSAMSKLLTDMQVAVATGSSRLEEFASVADMTGQQFQAAFKDDAAVALYSFIDGLNDVERNGADATVILENMGITEVRLSNAVKSLAMDSDGLAKSLSFANQAWEENSALNAETSVRYDTLESKTQMLRNAQQKLAVEIGQDLSPAVEKFVDIGTDMTKFFAALVEKSPAVTAAVVGVTTSLVALVGVSTVVSTQAIPKLIAGLGTFTTFLKANPAILAASAISGIVVGVTALNSALDKGKPEFLSWTAATQKQFVELKNLDNEYEKAVETYGATSEQALNLKYRVDSLTESFEKSKQTTEEFNAKVEKSIAEYEESVNKYEERIAQIDNERLTTLALVNQLDKLTTANSLTVFQYKEIDSIVDKLNTSVPDLTLNYDKLTGSLSMSTDEIARAAEIETINEKYSANFDNYQAALDKIGEYREELATARTDMAANYDILSSKTNTTDLIFDIGGWKDAEKAYKEAEKIYYGMQATVKETEKTIRDFEQNNGATLGDSAEDFVDYSTAVSTTVSIIEEELKTLITDYQEVYDEANQNINATLGLFNKMNSETERLAKRESELTDKQKEYSEAVKEYGKNSLEALNLEDEINALQNPVENMLESLRSQNQWVKEYEANLKKIAEIGFSTEAVDYFNDGSVESAANLADIVNELDNLSTVDGKSLANEFNSEIEERAKNTDKWSKTVADIRTDFVTNLDEMETYLNTTIENMNMEDKAAAAAKATMSAYVDNILAARGSVEDAALTVSNALSTGIKGVGYNSRSPINNSFNPPEIPGVEVPEIPGYAAGVNYAPSGFALVGERGPEIVQFKGGETVYPTGKFPSIFNQDIVANPPEIKQFVNRESEKKITLNINGNGKISFDKGVNKQEILDILINNLKPVLVDILQTEVNEESEGSYVY